MKSLIIGSGGQDGRILERKLRLHGHTTLSLDRPLPRESELGRLKMALAEFQPEIIYNLAGFSSVWRSWSHPTKAVEGNLLQVANLLQAIDESGVSPRVLIASSSELFQSGKEPIVENSPMEATSPYGVSKKAAVELSSLYRDTKGMNVRVLHLFNHESPLRGRDFVTQKIAIGVAKIKLGVDSELALGDISVTRDWGYAPDFAQAMIFAGQHEANDDYVVATGRLTPLENLIKTAFESQGLGEWRDYVTFEASNLRPKEHPGLVGNYSKLNSAFGWEPSKTIEEVIEEMVHHQVRLLRGETSDEEWLEERITV